MKILFVCMGNICRSPTVEGVFRDLLQQHNALADVVVDSAGTHAYHVGEAPDSAFHSGCQSAVACCAGGPQGKGSIRRRF